MLKYFQTYHLSVEFYHLCSSLKIKGHLKDQLLRASSSITLNLCEGTGRRTFPDQRKFYHISLGSLRECSAIFALANINDEKILKKADYLGACLYKLINRTP